MQTGDTLVRFIGVQNYVTILKDALFWSALRNSLVFFVGTVAGTMVLGTTIALLLDRSLGRFNWIKTLYLLPMVVAPVVVGIIESAAARARRMSLCGRSSRFWSLV